MTASQRNDACTLAAGTVVTSDYLPWARVLASSFRDQHPGVHFAVVVLDEPDPSQLRADDPFELLRPGDIGLHGAAFGWMAAIYDGFELSCAVKPWLLRSLLACADAALYLDSDILVCDALDDIARRAARRGLVLTPHSLEPLPDDGLLPDEDTFLRLGQFNAGFVAVGRDAGPFLDWWGSRLARECVRDSASPAAVRFVDQRWLDLAVNYFEVDVLRDRGANVAYWNLGTRRLEGGPAYRVDGEPLRFMHFSGFDVADPSALSKHLGSPSRVRPSEVPALQRICADYRDRLVAAGWSPTARAADVLPGGIALTGPVRAALRAALVAAERDGAAPALDPLYPGAAASLAAWLAAPVTGAGLSRHAVALHASHAAVRARFAQVPGADEARYRAWALDEGVRSGLVPAAWAQAPVRLDGARRFVGLVVAAELTARPALLDGLAARFGAADDVTLVIWAPGADATALASRLTPALTAAGLDGPDAPDLLGVVDDVPPAGWAAAVDALLTHDPVPPALALLPAVADARELRDLYDAATGMARAA